MKKFIKTLALMIFLSFAMCTMAAADVAVGPMIAVIGLTWLLIAAVVVIVVVLIVKLIIRLRRKNK